MDKATQQICSMLQSPDGMRRCAAAMVLAELKPKDPAVVKALGEALPAANQLLSRYILEAFDAIGTRAVVPYVLPLLQAAEVETKLRAASIIAQAGGAMVGELRKQLVKATPQQKWVLMDILARIHTREALQLILDTLFDPDAELIKEACQAVRRHIGEATPKDRVLLHKQVVQFMNSSRARKDERVLTACLLLVGYLGAPDARQLLLKYSLPKNSLHIRRHALLGLKNQEFAGAAAGAVAKQVFKYLREPDFLNIVQHALDIIDKLAQVKSFDAEWRGLLTNKHSSVRHFAARKIAAHDTPATNQLLMKMLRDNDPHLSEIAAGALARHKGATKLLLAALTAEKQSEPAWRLAKILKPHGPAVDKATVKRFGALAARDLLTENPRYEALFYFLRNVDGNAADNALREVGLKFKQARKWGKAVHCLKQLANGDVLGGELRYELSVCNLKQSPKDLATHLRAEDHSLRGFQVLVPDKKFKLADRLAKDKTLDATDLFYVGFHFAEGTGEELQFGQRLLEHVAKRWKTSKDGKAARNKLKMIEPAVPAKK